MHTHVEDQLQAACSRALPDAAASATCGAGGLQSSSLDVMKLRKLLPGLGNSLGTFTLNAETKMKLMREVDFWTEEEHQRLLNALALHPVNAPDWNIVCVCPHP